MGLLRNLGEIMGFMWFFKVVLCDVVDEKNKIYRMLWEVSEFHEDSL
jgi:hypothetical protein